MITGHRVGFSGTVVDFQKSWPTHITADALDSEPSPQCKGKATYASCRAATTSALVPYMRKTGYGWI